MKTTFVAGVLFLGASLAPALATPFPIVSVGDAVTGSFFIDPATPGFGNPAVELFYFDAGTMTANLGDAILSTPVDVYTVPNSHCLSCSQWGVGGNTIEWLDKSGYTGVSLHLTVSGLSNTISPPVLTDQFQGIDFFVFNGLIKVEYRGKLESLMQLGAPGNYAFSGTLFQINSTSEAPPPPVPVPAALPLFATGLAALGLLAWRRKQKAKAAL